MHQRTDWDLCVSAIPFSNPGHQMKTPINRRAQRSRRCWSLLRTDCPRRRARLVLTIAKRIAQAESWKVRCQNCRREARMQFTAAEVRSLIGRNPLHNSLRHSLQFARRICRRSLVQTRQLKTAVIIGRFLVYLIHLYSHSESAAIEVKVRIGQLWCPGEDSNLRHPL